MWEKSSWRHVVEMYLQRPQKSPNTRKDPILSTEAILKESEGYA